jgi:hypothetical protein
MMPWGQRNYGRGVPVVVSTFADRKHRAELGETAILLCTQLGISMEHLEALRDILDAATPEVVPVPSEETDGLKVATPDLVAALERLQAVSVTEPVA